MKTCSKCKLEKDEAEFSKNKSHRDGLDSRCKSCVREYQQTDAYKEYREAYQQTDTYKEYQKAYSQTDAYRDSQRAYNQTDASKASKRAHQHTDAYKEYKRAYYLRRKAAASPGNAGQSSDTKTLP